MTCNSCSQKESKPPKPPSKVDGGVLEARFAICMACDQNDAGKCKLLHGKDLARFSLKAASACPHPEKKW